MVLTKQWKVGPAPNPSTCPIWSLSICVQTLKGRFCPHPDHLLWPRYPQAVCFFFFFGVIFSRTAYINIITPPKVDPYLIHWDMFSMVIQSYGNFRGESEFSEQQVTKVISKCTLQGFIKGKTAHVLQGLCCRKSLQSKAKHRQMSLRGRRDIHLSSVVLWFGTFLCNLPIRQSKGESDWTIHGQPNVPITSSYYSQIKGI